MGECLYNKSSGTQRIVIEAQLFDIHIVVHGMGEVIFQYIVNITKSCSLVLRQCIESLWVKLKSLDIWSNISEAYEIL